MAQEANKRLFEVLDECVFQPVLQADEKSIPEHNRALLLQLKDALSQQRELFHTCASDEEVHQAFHEQINSAEAEKTKLQLHELGLPALADCREQFELAASDRFDEQIFKQIRPGMQKPNRTRLR